MCVVTFSGQALLLVIIVTISDSLGRRKWIGYLVDPSPQTHTNKKVKKK